MSSTVANLPETFSPPPRGTIAPNNDDDHGQPKSSSLYLFTFLSTLFLLLVVSTAIVLRSFLLRRRYRMRLEQQLGDIFRQPGDAPGTSRRRHFGAKPKLWDTWVKLGEEERSSTNELAAIKPLAVMYVPQESNKPKDSSTSPPPPQPEQERRHERSSAFLASLFAHPLALPRHLPPENDRPEGDSTNSSSEISRTAQVSVVISMPSPTRRTPPVSNSTEEGFPNVAIGLTRLRITNE